MPPTIRVRFGPFGTPPGHSKRRTPLFRGVCPSSRTSWTRGTHSPPDSSKTPPKPHWRKPPAVRTSQSGEHADDERAGDVDQDGSPGKGFAEVAPHQSGKPIPRHAAQRATNGYPKISDHNGSCRCDETKVGVISPEHRQAVFPFRDGKPHCQRLFLRRPTASRNEESPRKRGPEEPPQAGHQSRITHHVSRFTLHAPTSPVPRVPCVPCAILDSPAGPSIMRAPLSGNQLRHFRRVSVLIDHVTTLKMKL